MARHQAARELVGPAAKGVHRRDVAISQRVAERDDAAGVSAREHIDAADEEPVAGQAGDRHYLRRGEIARRRNVIGLSRVAASDLEVVRYLAGQIEADREIRERRHAERYRVA